MTKRASSFWTMQAFSSILRITWLRLPPSTILWEQRGIPYYQRTCRICIRIRLWLAIDQSAEVAQLSQEIQSGAQVTRQPAYSQTANSYGVNDLGDTYIAVDLSEQHMYYYQSGSLIFDSDFVSGNMSYSDRQTPSGIYTLYYKKSPDVLRGAQKPDGTYEYEEPVEYWMPFNGGIGFHDAPWRSDFGATFT